MSLTRPQNIIGGARVIPTASYAGGMWNLGEAAFYRSYYSSSNAPWPTNMITRGLIGYWDANNTNSYPGTGTTWSDLSGNGYTGTLTNGPTYSSSNGGGIVFDGSNDYVNVTYTGNTGNNFSVAVWCYPTAVGGTGGSDIACKNYAVTSPFISYGIEYLSTSKFRFDVANSTIGLSTVTQTGTSAINNFYYTVLTFGGDTSDKTIRGYVNINGTMTLDASSTIANNPAYSAQNFNIGSFGLSTTNNSFTGTVYVTQLYNVTLTAAEIQQNFDAMRGRFGI